MGRHVGEHQPAGVRFRWAGPQFPSCSHLPTRSAAAGAGRRNSPTPTKVIGVGQGCSCFSRVGSVDHRPRKWPSKNPTGEKQPQRPLLAAGASDDWAWRWKDRKVSRLEKLLADVDPVVRRVVALGGDRAGRRSTNRPITGVSMACALGAHGAGRSTRSERVVVIGGNRLSRFGSENRPDLQRSWLGHARGCACWSGSESSCSSRSARGEAVPDGASRTKLGGGLPGIDEPGPSSLRNTAPSESLSSPLAVVRTATADSAETPPHPAGGSTVPAGIRARTDALPRCPAHHHGNAGCHRVPV